MVQHENCKSYRNRENQSQSSFRDAPNTLQHCRPVSRASRSIFKNSETFLPDNSTVQLLKIIAIKQPKGYIAPLNE